MQHNTKQYNKVITCMQGNHDSSFMISHTVYVKTANYYTFYSHNNWK
jgi:hypothetical protein